MNIEEIGKNMYEKMSYLGTSIIDNIPNYTFAILIVLVFILLSKYIEILVLHGGRRAKLPVSIRRLFALLVRYAFVLLGLLIALSVIGLGGVITSLVAGVGIVGIALGFAFQDIAENFISGVSLAFDENTSIGDVVEAGGKVGVVEKVKLRSTTLRLADGSLYIVPNSLIFKEPFRNISDSNSRRVRIEWRVAYNSDLDKVERVVKEVIKNSILELDTQKGVLFGYTEFAGSAINFNVDFFLRTSDWDTYVEARNIAIKEISKRFFENNIVIPYHTEVHTTKQ